MNGRIHALERSANRGRICQVPPRHVHAPVEPAVRYERERPGELVHFDVRKLGRIGQIGRRIHGDRTRHARGVGWEFVHIAVDDRTRLAYAEVLRDERGLTAKAFLQRVIRWFARRGIRAKKTRACRQETHGKAERFIKTLIRRWAYATAYPSSARRTAVLPEWLRDSNTETPHRALGDVAPLACLRRLA